MKFFFMVLLQFALGVGFLQAQGVGDVQYPLIVNNKRNHVNLIRKEWARGYAKGAADREAGTGYKDTDSVAAKKDIPTSEAFQSGYRVGYTQKKPAQTD